MKAATVYRKAERRIKSISIHAAREGGDRMTQTVAKPENGISIHAAREGGD